VLVLVLVLVLVAKLRNTPAFASSFALKAQRNFNPVRYTQHLLPN
jgi:hypothetical protein